MKIKKIGIIILALALFVCPLRAFAQSGTHTVVQGDTMWKIAVRYQIGVSELIRANPQISNPSLIYPGQKINIPSIDDVKALEQKVIDLVTQQRAYNGLPALKANWEVCRVARYKSQDMIDKRYFAHQSPTYGSPFNMMENFGIRFSAAGENIAYGQRTPQEVMNSWMNSPGHRSNILNRTYNQIGVGVAKSSNGTFYWTQMFIKYP
ncbi:MAG: SafA/ExsA family spore coat assembly protein [Clostridiales bacterium]|nr:SafA/ExsA family spore coat assembly protein [Clostridiales bacterium]